MLTQLAAHLTLRQGIFGLRGGRGRADAGTRARARPRPARRGRQRPGRAPSSSRQATRPSSGPCVRRRSGSNCRIYCSESRTSRRVTTRKVILAPKKRRSFYGQRNRQPRTAPQQAHTGRGASIMPIYQRSLPPARDRRRVQLQSLNVRVSHEVRERLVGCAVEVQRTGFENTLRLHDATVDDLTLVPAEQTQAISQACSWYHKSSTIAVSACVVANAHASKHVSRMLVESHN